MVASPGGEGSADWLTLGGSILAGLIAHEWFAEAGGSENVVQEFIAAFPDSDLFVLWNDRGPEIAKRVYESWMASTWLREHKALALPLMPPVWRSVKAHRNYEWALVSSHLFAHHLRLRGGASDVPKLVYAHTPARYIWAPEYDSRGAGLVPRLASSALKPLDRRRAQEAVSIAANSEFTRKRIEACWEREARVVYPPVNVDAIASVDDWSEQLSGPDHAILERLPREFVLGASRFVPYKRLDLAIKVGEISGLPVVLAGDGPSAEELAGQAARAKVPVHFVGRPSDPLLYSLYQRSQFYAFPAIEDFGIMPVEAMAAGAPVIVPAVGGAPESVTLLGGGVAVPDFSPDAVSAAVSELSRVDRAALRRKASRFSRVRFRAEVTEWVSEETK